MKWKKKKIIQKSSGSSQNKNINGKGLMLAVNLGSPEYTLDVAKRCMEKGLIVFWQLYRNEYLRISPLTISKEEIEEGCKVILDVLNDL
jgi:acetylornithine/succinyldiaminopimelate/putrescine aminotransferase